MGELPPAGLGGRSVLVAGTRLPPPAPSEEPVTQPGCLGPAAAHCADKETKTSSEGILSRILLIRYGCISCHNVLPSRPSKIPHTVVSNCLLLPFVANVMPTLVSPPPPLLSLAGLVSGCFQWERGSDRWKDLQLDLDRPGDHAAPGVSWGKVTAFQHVCPCWYHNV